MLNANGVAVGRARVPSLVFFTHHLGNLSIGRADDIMRRDLSIAILEPTDAACVTTFCIMDYDPTHLFGARLPITLRRGVPNGRRIVGTAENTQLRRGKHIVMLGENRFQVDVIFLKTKLFRFFLVIQEKAHRIQHALHRINILLLPYWQFRKSLND